MPLPGGRRRVTKPAPFKRPSIELSGVKRCWRHVEARTLEAGDTVPGIGRIATVKVDHDGVHTVNVHGDEKTTLHLAIVHAYVKAEE